MKYLFEFFIAYSERGYLLDCAENSTKGLIENLSKYKYGVMLIPAVGSGTFALNCAYHGIPCVGNEKSDTQSLLFPDTSVDHMDIEKAVTLSIALRDDENFYEEVSKKAKNRGFTFYSTKTIYDFGLTQRTTMLPN